MTQDNRGITGNNLSINAIEEGLRGLPTDIARPEFREQLREDLRARAAQVLSPVGRREARRRGCRKAPVWRRLAAVAGMAAMLAVAAIAGTQAYDRYQIARLPKLPPTSQKLVGAGGQNSAVKEVNFTLATPLPSVPRKVRTYAPKLPRYTLAEAEQIAARLGVPGPAEDMERMWRFTDRPDEPWEGHLVDVQQPEPRVTYFNYEPATGPAVDEQQAVAAAKAFLQQAGLPYAADSVSVRLMKDRPEYEIHLIQRLGGYDAFGFETYIWVHRLGGAVASSFTTRVSYEPGLFYPIKTPAQAFEDLKHQEIFSEHERINVRIDSIRLAYYNFPRMNVPAEQTMMQPIYVFSGVDNYGEPFEAYVPAVPGQFIEPPQD
ncbi:MAG: hypothetical protein ACM3XN_00115 [Chloroflexota bacterium]